MSQSITTFQEFTARYRFDQSMPIGTGGFAQVFKAVDQVSGEVVAVKKAAVIPKHERYALYAEVQTAKGFRHPNLLRYHDVYRFVGEHASFDYAVMEYVNGGTLHDFLRTRPSVEQIEHVIRGLLQGLEYLHDRRIVHRDLKPANVLIQYAEGRVTPKIIDFGISKSMSGEMSVISNVVGSWQYMSPEQISPKHGDAIRVNSDLWTLGVILYEAFTGQTAFGSTAEGLSQEQIRGNILDGRIPRDLSELPEPFKSMTAACLVSDPTQRVQRASDLLRMMDHPTATGHPVGVSSPETNLHHRPRSSGVGSRRPHVSGATSHAAPLPARGKSNRGIVALIAGAVVLAIVLAIVLKPNGGNQLAIADNATDSSTTASPELTPVSPDVNVVDANTDNYYLQGVEAVKLGQYAEAVKLFKQGAAAGDAASMHYLGYLYQSGLGVALNVGTAIEWYTKAANKRYAPAQFSLGLAYEYGQSVDIDYAIALKWYQKAAIAGNPDAQCRLGQFYAHGVELDQNSQEAVRWYRKSADQGHAFGQFYLGEAYEYGEGIAQSLSSAAQWYEKSANQGHAPAQNALGELYDYGEGVEQSDAQALYWYNKAANQGNGQAQLNLAYMHMAGQGVAVNETEARRLFGLACEGGLDEACQELSFYEELERSQEFDKGGKGG